jgi:hypothetical protein
MAELPANPIERARMVAQLGLLEVGVGELDVLIADVSAARPWRRLRHTWDNSGCRRSNCALRVHLWVYIEE